MTNVAALSIGDDAITAKEGSAEGRRILFYLI